MINKTDTKSIGESFKSRRSERNISLKEAENATSIRSNFLQAIEEGEFNKLISPIYAQGFLKQYASFLGLDGEKIVRENPEVFMHRTEPEFSYGIGTIEMRGNPGSHVKWVPNALWVVLTSVVLFLAWYFAKYLELI